MLEASAIGQDWLERLAAEVARAEGEETALDAVDRWASAMDEDDAMAGLVYRTGFQMYLAGQLMVRAVELADEAADDEPGTVQLSKRSGGALRELADESFLGLTFEAALEFFLSKRLISVTEFEALQDRYKSGGFIARRLATERLREVARLAVIRILQAGSTVAEASRIIREAQADEVRSLGISAGDHNYIDTVVRTNVATAYGHGRWEAVNSDSVRALRPYLQYWTARDDRVRQSHRLLHGLVFVTGSEIASQVAPPNGYRCRCAMTTRSERQLERLGLEVTYELPEGAGPDEGWEAPPAPLDG